MIKKQIEITPYRYRVRCDMYKCQNLAELTIGNKGEPKNTRINLCRECLKGIIDAVPEEMLEDRINKIVDKRLKQQQEKPKTKEDYLKQLTVKELKDLARESGIDGYLNMKKEELIKALM